MDQSQRIYLLITFLILMKERELMVDSSPVRNSPPPFNVAEDVYVTEMYNVSVCVIDGTPYENGEFIPTIDPCESCICHPPGFACKMVRCKKVPTGCIQKAKRLDDCCPRVICDDAPTHNLVYRIGTENDTIVWSTEEPPIEETGNQAVPEEVNTAEEILVAESIDSTTENQAISDAPKPTTHQAESTSKVPSTKVEIATSSEVPLTTLKIATSSEVPLTTLKIATSSEVSTATIQIASTDLSNVSKDHLITKPLSEPTTMVVNYSIQLIVDSATFNPDILQDDVEEVRNPQIPIVNISLPLPAKDGNDLLRKPIENEFKVPLPTTLSVDIEVNKLEANNETSTHEDFETESSTIISNETKNTEEISSASEEKQLSNNVTTKLHTSEEQNSTKATAENNSNPTTPNTNSTDDDKIEDSNNSTLYHETEDNSSGIQPTKNDTTDAPSESPENDVKSTHSETTTPSESTKDDVKSTHSETTTPSESTEDHVKSTHSETTTPSESTEDGVKSTHSETTTPSESTEDDVKSTHFETTTPSESTEHHVKSTHSETTTPSESTEDDIKSTHSETTTPSESTDDDVKNIHSKTSTSSESPPAPPAVARAVDSDGNKFGQPEVPSEVTPLLGEQIVPNSDEAIINNDFDSKSNTFISPPKTDQIDQQNYNSFIPSGPIIFPNDHNFINEHGMRPRDIETGTTEKKEAETKPNQQIAEINTEKVVKVVTKEKNIPEINPTENNAEESSLHKTIEDQIQQETTTFEILSSEPSEKTIIQKQETSTKQLRDISTSTISHNPEGNLQLSNETDESEAESSVELENICPHYKRKLILETSEESKVTSNQESQQTEKDPEPIQRITTESEVALESSSKIPIESQPSTAQTEFEAPKELSTQSDKLPSAVPNVTLNQLLTSTELPKQSTVSVQEQSEEKLTTPEQKEANLATVLPAKPENTSADLAKSIRDAINTATIKQLPEEDEFEYKSTSLSEDLSTESTKLHLQPSTETIPEETTEVEKLEPLQTYIIEDLPVGNDTTKKPETTNDENKFNESVTENSSIKDNKTIPKEIASEPVIKIEIIPSEAKNRSDKTATEKQLKTSTESITTNSESNTEEVSLKADPESEKAISEDTIINNVDSVTTLKVAIPETETTKLAKEIENITLQNTEFNSFNNQAQTSENLPELQTQTSLSTPGSTEAESLVTHSQTEQETSKKDSPNTDFQQSTTQTMTSSPWTVVMKTIFSSVEPSSYDPLNEN
uniref:VWFC domain-containing protein n=1 Tax=Strigamia maritima TaxID=126957 RepID=T1IXF5_STRMM